MVGTSNAAMRQNEEGCVSEDLVEEDNEEDADNKDKEDDEMDGEV